MVTVQIAGEDGHTLQAEWHDNTAAQEDLKRCPHLMTATAPALLLRAIGERVKCCRQRTLIVKDGHREEADEDEALGPGCVQDPGWVAVTLHVTLLDDTGERLLSSSLVLSSKAWQSAAEKTHVEDREGDRGWEGEVQHRAGLGLKRILYLLHVESVWQLLQHKKKMVTGDSDVLTLVCPPELPAEELQAYAQSEDEAFSHHPSFRRVSWPVTHDSPDDATCSLHRHLSTTWTHPEFGRCVCPRQFLF